jgi:filamentous hemagglutinin family protein
MDYCSKNGEESFVSRIAFYAAVLMSTTALINTAAFANPIGGTVSAGSASIGSSGNTVTVTEASNKAVIDWQSFNIASNETMQFIQPSASSIVLNRINSGSPSQIFGHLDANGNIIILNPSGVLFGAGSQVDVNGLIATTSNISNQAFMANGPLAFNQPGGSTSAIVNEGTITAADAGLVGLVAPNVINSGTITAKLGTVHLASADTFTVDFYGDGLLNFGVSDAVKSQLVANTGLISAAGGKIALTAAAGNNIVNSLIAVSGKLSAPAVAQQGGKIFIYAEGSNAVKGNVTADKGQKSGSSTVLVDSYLDASGYGSGQTGGTITVLGDNIGIMSGALIDASGDAGGGTIKIGGDFHGEGTTPTALNTYIDPNSLIMANANTTGNGGNIAVWSDNTTQFLGNILAEGGEQSGNGGYVETSGHGTLDAEGYVDLTAPHGSMGTWLLDPTNISIYGGVTPAFTGASSGISSSDSSYVGDLAGSLKLWLDASNQSSVTLSYNSTGTTATGTSGMNTITVGSNSGLVVGERVQIGTSTSQIASVNDTSNIYTITAISGTSVTLDAPLAATATAVNLYGGYISQLSDLSGNANNAAQVTAADQPLWISNGQNGLGVMSFNGTSDYLSVANNSDLNNWTAQTISVSFNTSNGMVQYARLIEKGANSEWTLAFNDGGTGKITLQALGGASELFTSSQNLSDGNWHLLDTTIASSGLVSMYVDGLLNQSTTTTLPGATTGTVNIGQYGDGGYNYKGDMGDILIYNTGLSANAVALVGQYKSAAWGGALTGPGVIGTETGLTGAEAQEAMASVQAGATTDGYSVFTTSYLTRLSQTSNIILAASNNINLDLQGNTLSLAAGKNITLTAGHQILTDSTGTITTAQSAGIGGNITFNAANGIIFNNAFTLNSGGGNINLNNDVTLGAALVANAGSGALTFGGMVDGGYNLTATGAPVNFEGNVGSSAAIGILNVTGTANLYGDISTNNAAITFSDAVNLDANSTISSGTATATFSGTVNGDYNLTVSAGAFSLNGAMGGSTPLADVSLTSTDALTLPSISAASIFAQTAASADLTIGSGSVLTASGSGDAVTLASGDNFINSDGSGAIHLTGSGRWLIYSATPGSDTFGSLNSGNTAIWDATYGGTITQAGNRYLFSYQPTLTFTSASDSKTYGVDATAAVSSDYTVSGLETAVSNVYLADTATTAFSGTPSVTSSGTATTATVSGGPYTITAAAGTLAGVDGYALGYASTGSLTVNNAPLTITASNESKTYGGVYSLGTAAFTTSGLLNSDNVTSATLTSSGALATATVAGGSYNIVPSAASGSGLSNYIITYDNGSLTVTPAPLTITADNESKTYGTTYSLGTAAFTASGLRNSDNVAGVTLTSPGAASTASVAGGPYAIIPSAASGTGLSNYTVTYNNGALTVNAAPAPTTPVVTSLPSTVVVVSQNVPVYTSPDIASTNSIAVANSSAIISDAPQSSDQSSGSSGQESSQGKPQSVNANYTGNGAANAPVLSLFGGILTIDPAVVNKFKLGYLKNKS